MNAHTPRFGRGVAVELSDRWWCAIRWRTNCSRTYNLPPARPQAVYSPAMCCHASWGIAP
jgi:hypothetical protein